MNNWICTLENPAHLEAMKAAGVTTIRIGDHRFSARCVHPLTDQEITELAEQCRKLGMKWELMMNRIYMEEELNAVQRRLEQCRQWQPEGIVMMDPAVMMMAEPLGLSEKLIYAPDTLMTSWQDIHTMLQTGIGRVVIAAEITADEILEIARHGFKDRLELQIHGRQVMAYSRRPLVSNYLRLTGQSENWARDNRSLRLVESSRCGEMPVLEDDYGTSVFMETTLCSFAEIKELAASGIGNFFLEGLFSSDQELTDAVSGYQKILAGEDAGILQRQMEERYPQLNYGSGYLHLKTNLTKEEGR